MTPQKTDQGYRHESYSVNFFPFENVHFCDLIITFLASRWGLGPIPKDDTQYAGIPIKGTTLGSRPRIILVGVNKSKARGQVIWSGAKHRESPDTGFWLQILSPIRFNFLKILGLATISNVFISWLLHLGCYRNLELYYVTFQALRYT